MTSVNEPLLPSYKYTDEKDPSSRPSSDSSTEIFDETSTSLRLGGGDSAFTRVRERINGLSRTKKVLAISAIALLGLHFAGHGLKGHHGRRGYHKSVWEEDVDKVSISLPQFTT